MTDTQHINPRSKQREAATGGFILGVWLAGISLLSYEADLAGRQLGMIANILNLAGWVVITYIFSKRMASSYGDAGFSFNQCMGFILLMMLFAGFLHGGAQWALYIHDPEYFKTLINTALSEAGISEIKGDEMVRATEMMANPFVMIVSGIMTTLIYGGLTGLLISAFVKRPPVQKQQ